MARYIEKIVKSGLVKSRLDATDFAINPYIGCEHCCIYCYAPYTLHIPPQNFCSKIYVKRNLPTIVDREIKKVRNVHITLGTVTDSYQQAEKKFEITRKILKVLERRKVSNISILTKSSLVERDLDIIGRMGIEIGFTIITMDENMRKVLEPNSSSIQKRIKSLKRISEVTKTYVFIGPVIPKITDPYYIIEELYDYADYFIVDKLRLRGDMVQRISRKLKVDFEKLEEFNKKVKRELRNKNLSNVYIEF